MALKQPTTVSFFKGVFLCFLAIVSPASFDAVEQQDNKALEKQPDAAERYRINAVRRALGGALLSGVSASLVGFILGWPVARIFGHADTALTVFAVAGAAVLLWATLAARGWEIATWGNATLTERVNRWIFRGLYWVGTVLLVIAGSGGFWREHPTELAAQNTPRWERELCHAKLRRVASGNADSRDADGLAACIRGGFFTGDAVAPLSDCSFFSQCPEK